VFEQRFGGPRGGGFAAHAGPGWGGPHGPGRHGGPRGREGRGARHHLMPALLGLLKQGPQHGYRLMAELDGVLPRVGALPDVSSVYRTLADLEVDGAVVSRWEAGEGGGRRVYELTPQGEEMLRACLPQLEEERARLGHLIEICGG